MIQTSAPRVTVAPTVEPVTLDEAKRHCRVIGDDEDADLTRMIIAAREAVEAGEAWSLERALITQTHVVTLDRFPCGNDPIVLPRPPLLAVTSIVFVNSGNSNETLSNTLYTTITNTDPGKIIPTASNVWPVTYDRLGAVTVTYTAGYGATAASVPSAIKQAILLIVGDLYAHRESYVTGTIQTDLPSVRSLLNRHKWTYR